MWKDCTLSRIEIILIVTATALAGVLTPAMSSADAPLMTNVNVINNDAGGSKQEFPSLTVAIAPDNTLYAVWADYRHPGRPGMISTSTDRGQTWGDGIRNNNDRLIGAGYSMAKPYITRGDDGTLYLTYYTERGLEIGPTLVRFIKSSDNGNRWTTPVLASDPGQKSTNATAPDGSIYVATSFCEAGGCGLFLTKSTDSGRTFTRIYQNDMGALPVVRVDGNGTVNLLWTQITSLSPF
ncbi:sialidase family protein, partial [Acidobacteriota bacterium]